MYNEIASGGMLAGSSAVVRSVWAASGSGGAACSGQPDYHKTIWMLPAGVRLGGWIGGRPLAAVVKMTSPHWICDNGTVARSVRGRHTTTGDGRKFDKNWRGALVAPITICRQRLRFEKGKFEVEA